MSAKAYLNDTIAAIATAAGEASVCIVRLSGNQAIAMADKIFQCKGKTLAERPAGTFAHGYVTSDQGEHIDEVIALISRDPHSYTGEDVVELQGHGGSICGRRILRQALEAGARTAEPGEFTRRAFLNGKLDLIQAEAVLDLIHAQSERASTAALQQLEGSLSKKFNAIYDALIEEAADLEASLDFPEDELPETVIKDVISSIQTTYENLNELISTWDEGHLLRDGAVVVISGKPNVGKSTLLNALLENNRAIVSNTPGTTRDTIEEDLVLQGIPLRIVDTAGLRESDCDIEREGVQRTLDIREKADFHLYLIDASKAIDAETHQQLEGLDPKRCLLILNKIDLGDQADLSGLEQLKNIAVSLAGPEGAETTKAALSSMLADRIDLSARPHAVISERHRALLFSSRDELDQAVTLLNSGDEAVWAMASMHMRAALDNLGEATGKVYHDELLDTIFSRFCIGK